MSIVLKQAPKFTASAVINGGEVVNDFSLEQYLGKKYVVLFFYPKDFSGLCPTELHAFQEQLEAFEKRDTVVVGCSTDTIETHQAWLKTPQDQNGVQGITYPLVADESKTIAYNFGVLGGDFDYDESGQLIFEGAPIALRGTFLINKEGTIMHSTTNFFTLGRNIYETLRMVDAVRFFEENGEVCPANWKASE